jgi:hypothetical protein
MVTSGAAPIPPSLLNEKKKRNQACVPCLAAPAELPLPARSSDTRTLPRMEADLPPALMATREGHQCAALQAPGRSVEGWGEGGKKRRAAVGGV